MQVTEALNEGLKREVKVVVPAQALMAKYDEKLSELAKTVHLKGFRPGKVPLNHLRKMYGQSVMAEIVNDQISSSIANILKDRKEQSAMQPEIKIEGNDESHAALLKGEADLVYSLSYEIIPEISIKDVSSIEVERFIADVSEDEVQDRIKSILSSTATYKEKKGKAVDGDRLTIDYVGKIDGVAFENGAAKDAHLVLGSKQFIPGFEEQLIGVKAGDEKIITVTFPEDYGAEHLAGKEATFDINVKEVCCAEPVELNDESAKKLGVESYSQLQELIRQQIESHYGKYTRQKIKRQLFDILEKEYDFALPESLVQAEFDGIWKQVLADLERRKSSFEAESTTEEEAKTEYMALAKRRVRLGLVLAKIGEKESVEVSEEELQRALYEQLRHYPGQEKAMFDYFQRTPGAMANLRAPIFEEKVIDHLLGKIKVKDKKISPEELMKDDEDKVEKTPKKAKKPSSSATKDKEKVSTKAKSTEKKESAKKSTKSTKVAKEEKTKK